MNGRKKYGKKRITGHYEDLEWNKAGRYES